MDRIGIAKKLHEIRKDAASKRSGRRAAILTLSWGNMQEKDREKYLAEVDELLLALESTGHIVQSEGDIIQHQKKTNPLKVIRKEGGHLHIIGGRT